MFATAINWIIEKWNNLSFTLPSMSVDIPFTNKKLTFGGQTFNTPNIPTIPMLANGGIIDAPTLAMIGEGGEREIVTPDRLLRQIVREESGGGQPVIINQTFNGFSTDEAKELAREGTASALREISMRRRK